MAGGANDERGGCLNVEISRHTNDIIQKHTCALLREIMPEFYGIKIGRVKELINPELPEVKVGGGGTDMVFLTDEDKYLHLGFQTDRRDDDVIRHLNYDSRLMQRDGREVVTVIIYTADVAEAPAGINGETLAYNPHIVLMANYDGNTIYGDLNAKIEQGQALEDKDILNLLFLPLMKNTIPRAELATRSVEMAKTIADPTKRETCIAAAFAFANKYLGEKDKEKLLEVMNMADLFEMIEKRNLKKVARSMLQDRVTVDFVVRHTALDEETVRELKDEIENNTVLTAAQ